MNSYNWVDTCATEMHCCDIERVIFNKIFSNWYNDVIFLSLPTSNDELSPQIYVKYLPQKMSRTELV